MHGEDDVASFSSVFSVISKIAGVLLGLWALWEASERLKLSMAIRVCVALALVLAGVSYRWLMLRQAFITLRGLNGEIETNRNELSKLVEGFGKENRKLMAVNRFYAAVLREALKPGTPDKLEVIRVMLEQITELGGDMFE